MQAIRVHAFGGPEVMRLETVPDPVPGENQLLIRLRAIGVNPFDTYIRSGAYQPLRAVPYIPGADGAGEVLAIGKGVTHVKTGDRVYIARGSETYAELVVLPKEIVWPLPTRLSFEQGAAIGVPWATAYRALFDKACAKPGEWLLVHGASGGVGNAAVQIAKAHGMRIIGTAGTEEGRKLVSQMGAQHVLDHSTPDYLKEIQEITQDHGVDVILENLANVNLGKDLTILAKLGRVVVIGSRGNVEINPRETMGKDASIHGMTLYNATPEDTFRIHMALSAGFENGTFIPHIGRRFPLSDAPEAHRVIISSKALGKIVLIP